MTCENAILSLLSNGQIDSRKAFKLAAILGTEQIIRDICSENKKIDLDGGLRRAAQGNHENITNFLIEQKADVNCGLRGAAQGNNKHLVELCLQKRATRLNSGVYGAAKCHHENLAYWINEKNQGNECLNFGLIGAATGGHEDLVKSFLDMGANPKIMNEGLKAAAKHQHISLMIWFLNHGANDLKMALEGAMSGKQADLTETLFKCRSTLKYILGRGSNKKPKNLLKIVDETDKALIHSVVDRDFYHKSENLIRILTKKSYNWHRMSSLSHEKYDEKQTLVIDNALLGAIENGLNGVVKSIVLPELQFWHQNLPKL